MSSREPLRAPRRVPLAAVAWCAALIGAVAPLARAESARITGRVVDRETEAPIAGAEVELSNSAGGQGFFRARTGADGRFALDRVPPERWYNLDVGAPGYADFDLPSWQFPAAQRGAELVIPLDRAGSLDVRVVGGDGKTPVASAKVSVRGESAGGWEGYRPPPQPRWTGRDGAVIFADERAGAYTVQVEAEGLLTRELRRVTLRRGERTVLPVPMVRPASLSGSVLLADGSGVAGITVTARGASEAVTTTGADGGFGFGELAPGKYRIEASHEGFEPAALKEAITLGEGESRGGPARGALAVTVTPRPPDLGFVLTREVFSPGQGVRVGQRSFRVGVVDYTLYRFPPAMLLDAQHGIRARQADGDTTGLERVAAWSHPTADGPPYSWREEDIEVPGELANGAYLLRGRSGSLARHALFFVSDLGLLVKRSPTRLLVSAASLKTGTPLGGVPIYVLPGEPASPRPPGTGWTGALPAAGARSAVTDGRGLATIELSAAPANVRVVAVSEFSGVSVLESPLAPAAAQGGDRIFLYTDRPIYRPGQTVYWKAFARRATATGYALPEAASATIRCIGPDGAGLDVPAAQLSAGGTMDGAIELPAGVALGNWTVSATAGRASGGATVSVQEYRKPEFRVDVAPERDVYVNGDEVVFRVAAGYFFGSPVFGGAVRYTLFESRIRRDQDAWDWDERESPEPVGYGRVLKSGESRLDRDGRLALAFTPERTHYDRRLTLEVEVVDASSRAVSGRGSVTVGRGLFSLAVRPSRRVLGVGEAVPVEVTTLDHAGRPVSAAVTVELDQDAWNPLERRYTRSSRPLASITVTTDAGGHALARLTPAPARSGELAIRGRADDSRGNRIDEETRVWVWDARVADYAYRYPTLEALTDRPGYAPGDTARILVNTEVRDASVLMVVEGRDFGDVRVIRLSGHTGLIAVPLGVEDAPNCFVALHVRSGKEVHSKVLEIPVSAARHDLKIALATDRAAYRPGERAVISVDTRDASGAPAPAEVSVGVVDEAIYALRADDTPDPHEVFYGRRPDWISTTVSFPVLYFGGADKGGREEVRRDFRDVALWAPTVTTGANGHAEVPVTFPDNLTTWRITSRGATADTRVGAGVAKTLVTKEVVARLAGPRAFVAGDRASLVSVVNNRGGTPLTGVEETLAPSGPVRIAGAASRKADLAAQGEARATWAIETARELPADSGAAATATLVFRARSKADADAVETRIPVLARAVTLHPHGGEVVGGAGASLPVALPADLVRAGSVVNVELAASPAALALAGVRYLESYPYACTEQTANKILPACALLEAAKAAGVTPPGWEDPASRLRADFDRLLALQSPEGGWGWWREGEPDPFLTVLALDALARGVKLGIAPASANDALTPGGFRLLRLIDQVRSEDAESYVLAHLGALLALADAKTRWPALTEWRETTAGVLAAGADRLSPAGLALAAGGLAGMGRAAEARPLLDRLLAAGQREGRGLRWGESRTGDAWFGDDLETTAYALSALCALAPRDDRAAAIVWSLGRSRRGPAWRSTRTSAPVVIALADYVRAHPAEASPKGRLRVSWNGTPVLDRTLGAADAWSAAPLRVAIPGPALRPGANTLAVACEGAATVFLAWEADALVPSPGPDTSGEKRLRVGREFLRAERTTDRRGRPRILAVPLAANEPFRIGDAVLVRLTLHADRAMRWLVIEDPRLAGLEVEDAQPAGADWPWSMHPEVRDRRVTFFLSDLDEGDTVIEYLARPEIAGTFTALPVSAGTMYDPDLLVRSGEQRIVVTEK